MGDSSVAEAGMAATSKIETGHDEGTPSSIESTPEHDGQTEVSQEPAALPQKRKGGRKPIYATSEERKQRNRQAQAAFRERRTEYIKQLEATIKQNEDALATLQQSHRTAADECLMLRYKNSLLERILLEKGIDVQTELKIKTGSPVLPQGYMHPAANIPQAHVPQPPLQRAAVQRQQARRSGGPAFLPKLAPGQGNPEINFPTSSPQGHPTPSSHGSSPTNVPTRSPMAMHQGGMTSPASTVLAQGPAQQYHGYPRASQQPSNPSYYSIPQQPQNLPPQQQRPPPPSQYQSSASVVSSLSTGSQHSLNPPAAPQMMSAGQGSMNASAGPPSASAYYPSPFQKHIDQLEQEYDTQQPQSMLDHPEHDADHRATTSPTRLQGTYPPQFDQQQRQQQAGGAEFYQQSYGAQNGQQQMAPHPHYDQSQMMNISQAETASGVQGPFAMGQVIDPNDPMLDADPFGLSASMHYPTSYSAMDQQQRR